MELRRVVAAISFFTLLKCITAQNTDVICNAALDCAACIQANAACAWCSDTPLPEAFDGRRCYDSNNAPAMCSDMGEQAPRSAFIGQSDEELSATNQITPRSVNVTVRPGDPTIFNLDVQPARNFPLDIYMLMDLSASMRDDLDNLKALGASVATQITGISTNFQLGFGSFVDKRINPYVSQVPSALNDPCGDGCDGPYSYRHIVSLTTDSDEFNDRVQERMISGNLDAPEGGFDGFIQAITCQDLIGWRDEARHILLYITDAGFHYAGDGKLGAAIRPNPGVCLTGDQVNGNFVDYLEYGFYDYPSIGQIAARLRDFDIIPIFAATSGASSFYNALAAQIEGAEVGTLASDSSNVLTLLDDTYTRLSQRVIVSPDNVPGVSIVPDTSNCPSTDEDNNCDGIAIEQMVTLPISVSIDECNEQFLNGPVTVNVRVVGFGSFDVTIDAICSCDCEELQVENATECSLGNGTFVCGICECNEGRFGEMCQCDSTGTSGSVNDCPIGDNGEMCSARGRCVCGRCVCDVNDDGTFFFGQACECDNFQCPRADDEDREICGGPSRGTCQCDGTCLCRSTASGMYTGDACDCSPDTSTCINNMDADAGQTFCSGNGRCECGSCICQEGYSGSFCQICTDSSICSVTTCNTSQVCAMCAANVTTEGCEACDTQVTSGPMEMINGFEAVTCEFTDENCEYRYYVAVDDDGTLQTVFVDDNEACSTMVAPWIIAVSIIAGLLILGLLLLALLKIILMILDYIEVKKFLQEVQDPKFRKQENPLWQDPVKEYKNPVYGQ